MTQASAVRACVVAAGLLTSSWTSVGCGATMTESVAPLRSEPIRKSPTPSPADRFGAVFCAALNHVPDAAQWGMCARYLAPAAPPVTLGATIPTSYRVLVVAGIFGQCVETLAKPWEDAKPHMSSAHQIDIEYARVTAVGGVHQNALMIMQYLDTQFAGSDQRRYIVFGYSKGASDVLDAIQSSPTTAQRIAAVVTIAGSVLGSRGTDSVPRGILSFFKSKPLGPCDLGDSKGLDDLRRKDRVAAMRDFETPATMKMYSIAAVSTLETTSKVLQSGWQQLSVHSREQDSQMIHEDAIIPGGAYLGMALGDHWAVALPFETASTSDQGVKSIIKRLIDQNHFPRVALFEAALRYVLYDLGASTTP